MAPKLPSKASTNLGAPQTGQQLLSGGKGDDIYAIKLGGKTHFIHELESEGADTVDFTDISFSRVNVSTTDNNLVLSWSTGSIILSDLGMNIEHFEFSDGVSLSSFVIGGNEIDNFVSGGIAMAGTTGNDLFWIGSASDQIAGTAHQGVDTVLSAITFVLRDYSQELEHLGLTGTANINGVGNQLANVIEGNDGNNILNGAWGDDTLRGGAGDDIFRNDQGNDVMTGGLGNDVFEFNTGDGTDTITDFEVGSDVIRFVGTGLVYTDLTLFESAGDVTIAYGTGSDTILLSNMELSLLAATDFEFV